jgi:CheY-like chemotaxis protein
VLAPRVVDANAIVLGMEKLLRRLIGSDIELRVSLAEGQHPVLVDPGQLEQVIMNLAVNARDAMPDGGVLTLATSGVELDATLQAERADLKPGRYALIAVSDTGVGMSSDVKTRLFEPFFTTKEIGRGTGLGLATVYGIVQQSHGAVWVHSELGQGSTFKVYLPLVEGAPAPSAEGGSAPREVGGTENILVVDDDPQVRALAERALREQGYRVTVATNGKEALALLESAEVGFDLLVSDLVMPGMRGTALAGKARAASLMYEWQGTVAGCWLSHLCVDVLLMIVGYELIMMA